MDNKEQKNNSPSQNNTPAPNAPQGNNALSPQGDQKKPNWFQRKFFTKKDKSQLISSKESKRISKENFKITKMYEKRKKRKNVAESQYVTQMKDNRNIVEFDDLHTFFYTDAGVVRAVNGVTFSIPQGSTVGIVGESGCGKSVTSLSLMQLVQAPQGQVIDDDKIHSEIRFKSTIYKEKNGKKIPIYEYETTNDGVARIKERPVMSKRMVPVYEYETTNDGVARIKERQALDKNGKPVLDKNGKPVMEKVQKERQALDKNGKPVMEKVFAKKPVLDKNGKPVMEKVQKTDSNGILLFETEEKVYNVAKMPYEVMRKIRGREITMIFQEPMTSLNPIFRIGDQLDEVVLLHTPGATKASAKARTYEMLKLVGIIPENVYRRYPHELSGGMRQRVVIAMALMCNPKLIIADEPTTALDVTIQAQILDLLRSIKTKISGSIMLITHDLGVIAEMADFVVVMYAGRIVEMGTAYEIFKEPLHPYTVGLQKSKPSVNNKVDRLYSIPGSVPNPINMPAHCYFKGRCSEKTGVCEGDYPCMRQISPTHKVACHLYQEPSDSKQASGNYAPGSKQKEVR